MGKRLTHLENLALALIKQNQPEETLPMTKDCENCRYFYNIRCHTSGVKLNPDEVVGVCHYTKCYGI